MAQTRWTAEQLQVIIPAEIILVEEYRKAVQSAAKPPYDQDETPPVLVRRARPCARCGHSHNLHCHWRAGSDCAICGKAACPTYRRPGIIPAAIRTFQRLWAWWKRVSS